MHVATEATANALLAASHQTVVSVTGAEEWEGRVLHVSLVFGDTLEPVPGTTHVGATAPADTLVRTNCIAGKTVCDGSVEFRVRLNELSSRHGQRKFSFCVATVDGKPLAHSEPFRALSKLPASRGKRKRPSSEVHSDEDALEALLPLLDDADPGVSSDDGDSRHTVLCEGFEELDAIVAQNRDFSHVCDVVDDVQRRMIEIRELLERNHETTLRLLQRVEASLGKRASSQVSA